MTYNPFIPLPLMAVICIALLVMKRKGVWNFIKQIIIVLLLFGLNMRILIPSDTVIVSERPIDILFVVDNTISMLADDYSRDNQRRLDAVKSDVSHIIEEFPGARFGLITFDNRADYVVPYTNQGNLIISAVNNLQGAYVYNADGTSLNIVIPVLEETLEHNMDISENDDENLARKDLPKRLQIVFIMTDGEITNEERLRSFEGVEEYIDTGAVLGYGTRDGATMRYRIGTETEVLTYYNDNFDRVTPRSCIDEDNLESIAEDMEVEYYHMQKSTDYKKITATINEMIEDGEFATYEEKIEGYGETYQWFGLALLVIISIDYVSTRLKMRRER